MVNIYESLESFSDFAEFSNSRHYMRLPQDWSILVADIVGSTEAIQAGRYRELNTIGGACIAAVKNALNGSDFPSVFGGDGASIAVPEESRLDALFALLGVRRMVQDQFNLELNVGYMTIRDVEEQGVFVEVCRYELAAGKCIALFTGGGLAYARSRLRIQESLVVPNDWLRATVNLQGLNCRWNAIPNSKGCIMSLLVCSNPNASGHVYSEVMDEIDVILRNDRASANPVNIEIARFKSMRQLLKEERRFHSSLCSPAFMMRVVEITMGVVAFRLGMFKGLMSGAHSFRRAIRSHADHVKFDDMLRMVIDCSKDQANAIECMLQDKHCHGHQLCYGAFYSTHTLMTCFVQDMTDGNHIHFIDGDNGGYVMAAQQLRKQISELQEWGNDTPEDTERLPAIIRLDDDDDYSDDLEEPSLKNGQAPTSLMINEEPVEVYGMFSPLTISSNIDYSSRATAVWEVEHERRQYQSGEIATVENKQEEDLEAPSQFHDESTPRPHSMETPQFHDVPESPFAPSTSLSNKPPQFHDASESMLEPSSGRSMKSSLLQDVSESTSELAPSSARSMKSKKKHSSKKKKKKKSKSKKRKSDGKDDLKDDRPVGWERDESGFTQPPGDSWPAGMRDYSSSITTSVLPIDVETPASQQSRMNVPI